MSEEQAQGAPADTPATTAPAATDTKVDTAAPSTASPSPSVLDATDDAAAKAPPPTWPDNWRARLAGEDAKELKRLERLGSPQDVWKAYRALEAKVSSGQLKQAKLADDATEDQVAAFRKENGVPEKPDGYLDAAKDIVDKLPPDAQEGAKVLADRMHKINASPAVVKEALAVYAERQQEALQKLGERDNAARKETEDALRAEWGGDFRRNINAVNGYLDTQLDPDTKAALLNARGGDGNALFNNPKVVSFLLNAALEANPAGTVVPGAGASAGKSIDERIADINSMMGNRNSDYWKSPKSESIQAEYRQLLVAKEKLQSKAR